MYKQLTCAFALCLPFVTNAAQIRHEHPRLFLDPLRTEKIKQWISTTAQAQSQWLQVKAYADQLVAENKVTGKEKDAKLLMFTYVISANPQYFSQAKEVFQDMRKPFAEETDDQIVCPKLETAAVIYDWGYNSLTGTEKSDYKNYILDATNWLNTHNYLSLDTVVGGHGITGHTCALQGLIAIKYDSTSADSYLESVTAHIFNNYLPFYRFLSEEDGGFHMGWEYTRYYNFEIIRLLDVWRSATGEDLFLQNNWLIKSQRFQTLYGINDQAEPFKTGDIHVSELGAENRLFALKIAQEYQDGIAESAMEWMYQHNFSGGADPVHLVYDLLWTKQNVAKQPFDSLDKARLFNKAGIVSFRESWELMPTKGSITAIFKSTPFHFSNHSHRDANSFLLSLNGDLALDSGYYDYYKSPHWRHYYTQSVAHNTLLFEQKTSTGSKFIGQENRKAPGSLKDVQSGKFNSGGIVAFENNDLYSYAKGVAGQTYPAGLIDKFDRHFVFLRAVAKQKKPLVVIFDDLHLLDSNIKPTWLLHCLTEPQLVNEHEFNCSNEKSRLDVSIIQPQLPKVTVVGGKNAEFINDGINYPPTPYGSFDGVAPAYAGSWRVELQNKEKPAEQFLVILAAKNKKQKKKLAATKLENQQQAWQGVEIEDWRLLFNQSEAMQAIDFAAGRKQHVLVLGLAKKQPYLVSGLDNKKQAIELLSSDAGTLLFKSQATTDIHLQRKIN